jgi:putative hemin transport protein
MKTEDKNLDTQWRELLENEPKLRIRDAATRLGVGEVELLATRCGGGGVTRLSGDPREILKQFPRLGRVMCLTRNEHAVHERYGEFRQIDFFGPVMGQVVGPDIDLRIFMHAWDSAFAVVDETKDGARQSFQFFDKSGTAVHKVYLQPDSHLAVFGLVLEQFRAEDQSTTQSVQPAASKSADLPDAEIDGDGFREAWLGLKDTHAFFNILKKFRVGRHQALRLAPAGYARQVFPSATRKMLETVASSETPIMVFIGNPGCIQIHTGPVKNIKMFGTEWLNVLDEDFNMHLRDTAVASAYVVRKPTDDGDVTSLELFDADGENLVLFFGKRKPGQPEDPAWRAILAGLS